MLPALTASGPRPLFPPARQRHTVSTPRTLTPASAETTTSAVAA